MTSYAVIVHYWNGSTYALDRRDLVVYTTKEAAYTAAAAYKLDAETTVDVVEVEIHDT